MILRDKLKYYVTEIFKLLEPILNLANFEFENKPRKSAQDAWCSYVRELET